MQLIPTFVHTYADKRRKYPHLGIEQVLSA